ncbi:hypothetical protein Pcinc_001332 [Petrolisthes cinctipes]|uniref:Uncharacterized protein n=1 Tax=Petrolisthes cinctipes TaxID=88211 RepID=A0AAE1L4N3_PETCI|nr:hypothetical protein Pcinc_001332 [Petrolisthes cinctipes]
MKTYVQLLDCDLSAEGAVGFAHCRDGDGVRSSSPRPSTGVKATTKEPVTDSTATGALWTVSGEPLPRGAARMSTGGNQEAGIHRGHRGTEPEDSQGPQEEVDK